MEAFPVTAVKFDSNHQILLLADEFGNIQGWSMSEFLEGLVLTRVEKSILSRRRDHKGGAHVSNVLYRNLLCQEKKIS